MFVFVSFVALHLVGVLLGDGRADGDARDDRAADFVDAPNNNNTNNNNHNSGNNIIVIM